VQEYYAETEFGRDLSADERFKFVCVANAIPTLGSPEEVT
jgi:hypothetical protein